MDIRSRLSAASRLLTRLAPGGQSLRSQLLVWLLLPQLVLWGAAAAVTY
ncbi:MAG: hypothetical protein RL375_2363 [Pseudomonadota bacterium]